MLPASVVQLKGTQKHGLLYWLKREPMLLCTINSKLPGNLPTCQHHMNYE